MGAHAIRFSTLFKCHGFMCQSAEFSSRMCKLLRSLAYMFDSYITCLTLSLNTVYVYFHSLLLQSWIVITLAFLKSILSLSRSSLEHKKILRVLCPLKPLLLLFFFFLSSSSCFIQYMKQVKNYKSNKNGLFKSGT